MPERTYQATILQLRRRRRRSRCSVRPTRCPGAAASNVQLQAKLGGDLPGVRDYFEHYPYTLLRAAGVGRHRPRATATRWDG